MKYLSVCSGIEAATVAWKPLGWQAVAYSEIEKFPSAVLAHHYGSNMPGEPLAHNGTPNLGDMTKYKDWPDYADINVLVGGTPCQSFSVAGLRKGMADPRGNLALVYLGIADRYRPDWLVWENVPGVLSSNEGRDFGAFLGALGKLGYGWSYRVLDAQYFGVAQRRRRVFVVGYLGDWRPAHAVLSEPESLCGHPAPRRETGAGTATGFEVGPGAGGFTDLSPTLDARCKDGPIRNQLGAGVAMAIHPHCIGRGPDAGPQGKEYLDDGSAYTMDSRGVAQAVAFDWYSSQSQSMPVSEECPPLKTTMQPAVAFHENQRGELTMNATAGSLKTNGGKPGQGYPAVLYSIMPQNSGKDYKARECEVTQPLMTAPTGGNQGGDYLMTPEMAVRRLTPRECERLQGFPDEYTQIPYRNKEVANCPDGPRYKALGNSMAVPVMRWIGERIELVNKIRRPRS